jgi:hypothetical protein
VFTARYELIILDHLKGYMSVFTVGTEGQTLQLSEDINSLGNSPVGNVTYWWK